MHSICLMSVPSRSSEITVLIFVTLGGGQSDDGWNTVSGGRANIKMDMKQLRIPRVSRTDLWPLLVFVVNDVLVFLCR